MRTFPALIFDLDGTLADTAPDLLGATNAVLAARGLPVNVAARMRLSAMTPGTASRSMTRLRSSVSPLAASPMHLLALIKPQFEADRKLAKKGVVRDEAVHRAVCDDIAQFVASLGCTNIEVFPSAILGGDGNREFFIGARRG